MNNQNFYLRLIALLLIIMAVFFYNGTVKDKEQAQDIADLTAKVESLENQQNEILTALQETYEEQKARLLRTHLIQNLMVHLKKILQTTKKAQIRRILKKHPMIPIMYTRTVPLNVLEQDMVERSQYR